MPHLCPLSQSLSFLLVTLPSTLSLYISSSSEPHLSLSLSSSSKWEDLLISISQSLLDHAFGDSDFSSAGTFSARLKTRGFVILGLDSAIAFGNQNILNSLTEQACHLYSSHNQSDSEGSIRNWFRPSIVEETWVLESVKSVEVFRSV